MASYGFCIIVMNRDLYKVLINTIAVFCAAGVFFGGGGGGGGWLDFRKATSVMRKVYLD